MKSTLRTLSLAFALPFASMLTGCQMEPEVTAEEARLIAEQALSGFNAGDYATWSAEWSPDMKAAMPEEKFHAYRDEVLDTAGKWISIEQVDMQVTDAESRVAYVFDTKFEKAPIVLRMVFPQDGTTIEAVSLEERRRNTTQEPAEPFCPPYLGDKCEDL